MKCKNNKKDGLSVFDNYKCDGQLSFDINVNIFEDDKQENSDKNCESLYDETLKKFLIYSSKK